MKNLDLNAYGVVKMNQQEMLSENGGCAPGPNGEDCTEIKFPDILKFKKLRTGYGV